MNDAQPSASGEADSDIAPLSGGAVRPPPPRIPDHELIRRIGRGAYGEVWIARSVTGAYRAVKIVRRDSFDHERPFEREFEGILKFEPISRTHDSQVDILHVGRGDGYFYYVMELADDQATGGQINPDNYHPRTLKSDLFFRSRLPFEECVSVGIALTTALEHLHKNELVHRDVKPSNIIFVNGVAKLADIGLVTGTDTTRSYVGTEGFAAPEGPGTPQGDIFSLGKVLYEMSTGKDRQEFPELPTNLRELPEREGLVELNAVVARSCRHDPRDRYPNASAMRADLELLQSGKSLARLHRVERRLQTFRRLGIVLIAMAFLAMVAWWFQAIQTQRAKKLAAENQKLADRNRQQIVQLNKMTGFQKMKEGDLGGAILFFDNALRISSNDSAETEMDRRRISMLLQMHPKPVARFNVFETNGNINFFRYLSPDGERLLFDSDQKCELWQLTGSPHRIGEFQPATNRFLGSLSEDGEAVIFSYTNQPHLEIWPIVNGSLRPAQNIRSGKFSHVRLFFREQRILAVETNATLVVLDASTGRRMKEIAHFNTPVRDMIADASGKVTVITSDSLLTEGGDVARVFDWKLGTLLHETSLKGRRTRWNFANNTRYHSSTPAKKDDVSYERGGDVQLWDAWTGQVIGPPLEHSDYIRRTVPSPNGRFVVTATAPDHEVRIWNAMTGDLACPPIKCSSTVETLCWSPDSTRVALAYGGGTVQICDARTGRFVTPPLAHSNVYLLDFILNGAALSVIAEGVVTIWDLTSIEGAGVTLETPARVDDLAFNPSGDTLLARSGSKTLTWDVTKWNSFTFEHSSVKTRAYSRDYRYLAIANRSNLLRVWDTATGKPVGASINHSNNSINSLAFSADGSVLATATGNSTITLWDWRQGKAKGVTVTQQEGVIRSLALSPDGERLLCVSATGAGATGKYTEWLWNIRDGVTLTNGTSHAFRYGEHPPIFSPDGSKWIDWDPLSLQLRFSSSGAIATPRIQHNNTLISAEFSIDGKTIFTVGADDIARVSDSITGKLRAPLIEQPGLARAFLTDSDRQMLTVTAYRSLQMWDVVSGFPLVPPGAFELEELAVHPNGRLIAMATRDHRIVVKDFGPTLSEAALRSEIPSVTGRILMTNGAISLLPQPELLAVTLDNAKRSHLGLETDLRIRWHKQHVIHYDRLSRLEESLFHARCLVSLQPDEIKWRNERDRLAAARIPSRDTHASLKLIDLSSYYTRSLETVFGKDVPGLPAGVHHLVETDFDLRGVIVLDEKTKVYGLPNDEPQQIGFIPIKQSCTNLQVLETGYGGTNINGSTIATFLIHYADGTRRTWRLVYGEHLRNVEGSAKGQVTKAVIAWQSAPDPKSGRVRRLFKATWPNPTPDVEISHISLGSEASDTRIALLAITVE
jgi:WD40 repeat protein